MKFKWASPLIYKKFLLEYDIIHKHVLEMLRKHEY